MRRVLVLVGVLALAAAACGGDDSGNGGDGDGDATTAAAAGGSAELSYGMIEFEFDPTEATVASGSQVSVTAENQGSIEHSWILVEAGQEVETEDEIPDDLGGFAIADLHADAGETGTASFTAPAAGTYQIICDIAGHFSAGMEATLTVTG